MPEALFRNGDKIRIPAQPKFTARDHFVPNVNPSAQVLIVYIQGAFNRWFLNKTEDPTPETSLTWYELQRDAGDQTIVAELGGTKYVESTLSTVFALMEQQRRGQEGPLASNGWGNNFYVRDTAGELRSVYIHWCDEGWGVDAAPIVSHSEWPIRDRVFAPASM